MGRFQNEKMCLNQLFVNAPNSREDEIVTSAISIQFKTRNSLHDDESAL